MATSLPLPSNPHVPATPPPENQTFGKTPLSPQLLKTFAQELYGVMGGKLQPEMVPPAARSMPLTTNLKSAAAATSSMPAPIPGLEALNNAGDYRSTTKLPSSPTASAPTQHPTDPANDARYLAMASRIANYYQQRCQAVANYQQQRCQAWANMHRQKCQEMMQAAMLVVAWYIRDRIARKRKRAKRRFKRGLAEKGYSSSRPKTTRGDTVRRWVVDVPSLKGAEENNSDSDKENEVSPKSPRNDSSAVPRAGQDPNLLPPHDRLLDSEEAEFSMDRETPPDKDTKLFAVADNLIKSQLAKIDVPLLGALSFDESDSDSEDEDEIMPMYRDYDGKDVLEDDEDMADDEDEEYYDDEEEGDEDYEEVVGEETGSEQVHVGTGKGSRKRTRSSVS